VINLTACAWRKAPVKKAPLKISKAAVTNQRAGKTKRGGDGGGTQRHIDPSEGLSQNVNRSEKQEKAKRAPEQAPTSGAEIIWAQISALARWW